MPNEFPILSSGVPLLTLEEWREMKCIVDSLRFVLLHVRCEDDKLDYLSHYGSIHPELLQLEGACLTLDHEFDVERARSCIQGLWGPEALESLGWIAEDEPYQCLVQAAHKADLPQDPEPTPIDPQRIGGRKGANRRWASHRDEWPKWQEQIDEFMEINPHLRYSDACRHVAKQNHRSAKTIERHTVNPRVTTMGR